MVQLFKASSIIVQILTCYVDFLALLIHLNSSNFIIFCKQ